MSHKDNQNRDLPVCQAEFLRALARLDEVVIVRVRINDASLHGWLKWEGPDAYGGGRYDNHKQWNDLWDAMGWGRK